MSTRLEPNSASTMVERYAEGKRAVGQLSRGGTVRLDPELPFLFVHRVTDSDDLATARLLGGESSVVLAGRNCTEVERLVRRVAEEGARRFGAFLVIEIWAGEARDLFVVKAPEREGASTPSALKAALEEGFPRQRVRLEQGDQRGPEGRPPLLTIRQSHEQGTLLLGLTIPPTYRSEDGTGLYPVHLRSVQRRLSTALRRAAFDFVRVQSSADVASYRALGPRVLDERAVTADRELADIEKEFSLLLLVAQVDPEEAWERFLASEFERDPHFHYRLLPFDPDLMKRRLFGVPLEEVEDPALHFLLREKREELDRRISLLADRNTPAFRPGSIRLYGTVDEKLVQRAEELLSATADFSDDAEGSDDRTTEVPTSARAPRIGAAAFAARAQEEFALYRRASSAFEASVQVRSDLADLMVSSGRLLIGRTLTLPADRVEPLIHHEVGTHVLTWCNGAAQPLIQLRNGLAGYDELQEGLAVFAEYLVGGLSRLRMRVLGARVLAAAAVQSGAGFVETFRVLHWGHGFTAEGAFGIASRVHACGGFTRDAIYLRGLVSLLRYLEDGGSLEPLYVGKLALRHVPILEELTERGILSPSPIRPRYLDFPEVEGRLERARNRLPLADLID